MGPIRDVPFIWDTWRSGIYVGDTKPSTRVTVEKGWRLRTTDGSVLGTWNRGPARYYGQEGGRPEVEIPGISNVSMTRSIETDAGTCDITLQNILPTPYGAFEPTPGQYGDTGYFTWDHGEAQEARARWAHTVNPWNDVLVPNALIRTYQGFGGTDKTIDQAVADGNLVLNGVWLVDDITISTAGTINMRCRDMAKLLLDQHLYPPLVPRNLYPLHYVRWIIKDTPIPAEVPGQGSMCFPCEYAGSSTDEYYGEWNTPATGHRPTDAFDISAEVGPPGSENIPGFAGHQRTYWLSEPKGGANDHVWIEFLVNGAPDGDINQVYYHAWAGNVYAMVSVFEHGQWVPAEGPGGGVTPEGIPYVGTVTIGWEGDQRPGNTNLYDLPRDYRASRIRLTVTNLTAHGAEGDPIATTEPGYRAGIRKVMACFSQEHAAFPHLVFAGAGVPVNDDNSVGYWQARSNGQVFAFGDARVYDPNSPSGTPLSTVLAMTAHPSGHGYWLLDAAGRVISAGDAHWFGDLSVDLPGLSDVVDIAPSPSGNGYWLLRHDGTVWAYGDAVFQGNDNPTGTMPSGAATISRSIESHPTAMGYWVVRTDGIVTAFNVTHHGNANLDQMPPTTGYVACIRRTSTGNGYWIGGGKGIVQAFGDAPWKGNAAAVGYDGANWFKGLAWDLIPTAENDQGYAIQHADGKLEPEGDVSGLMFGSIGEGLQQQRFDGNYKDYTDIIRDLLLWGGFYLYKNPQPVERPDVFGNLESTGAYATVDLDDAMFDKRPIKDAINDIRNIVGYVFFIDAEGGARFESTNWWTQGNYLSNVDSDGARTPYPHMPEIDELVQLTSHQIVFSANQARSELIIAPEDPSPKTVGVESPAMANATIIRPRTADDLRGLLVPAMWPQGEFLNPAERKVMADLIDLRMWFSRRTASIECVGNPLIDINDQVRVMERQTGEVYVHYVRGVSMTHDLESGDFTMSLTTHWLGGTPYGETTLYLAASSRPQGDGYWQVTLTGGIYAYGNARLYEDHQGDSHLEWVVGFRSTPTGLGYYSIDVSGKVLTYGDAVHQGDLAHPTNDVIDMALTPTGDGYWILQIDGTVTSYGDATHHGNATVVGNMQTGSPVLAQSIESHPTLPGYWILLSTGTVYAFDLPHHGGANRDGFDFAEYVGALRRTHDGGGYWILSGGGIIQAKGNAPWLGNAIRYGDNDWVNGLCWEMITNPTDGYAVQHADGTLDAFVFTQRGAAGTNSSSGISWSLVSPEAHAALPNKALAFPVSAEVREFLASSGSPSGNNAAASNFDQPQEATIKALTP